MISWVNFTEALAVLLLAAGLFFTLAAVVGILRLPDFFTRLHAIGKCDTAGLSLSLLGSPCWRGIRGDRQAGARPDPGSGGQPTATHALARAPGGAAFPCGARMKREIRPESDDG